MHESQMLTPSKRTVSEQAKHEPFGLTLWNDGEVRVFIPFRRKRGGESWFKTYNHAQTQRRMSLTPEKFLGKYPVMDGAKEKQVEALSQLGISREELDGGMQVARRREAEYHNLLKLVAVFRRVRKRLRCIHGTLPT